YEDMTVARARTALERSSFHVAGTPVQLASVRGVVLPLGDDAASADLNARWYRPDDDEELPVLIYFHGGGWVLGSIDSHDSTCRYLARTGGLNVLSVDYRMAPEHLFPTAVDDALAAFRYVRDHARTLGVGPNRIAVGGDSAGGNLAAVVCQQTRGAGERSPDFQLLFVPATDMSARTRSYELFKEGFYLTADTMGWYERTYIRSDEDRLDPRASPLLAEDLSGLPPAHVATAGFDPLRDEGQAYARRLADAGAAIRPWSTRSSTQWAPHPSPGPHCPRRSGRCAWAWPIEPGESAEQHHAVGGEHDQVDGAVRRRDLPRGERRHGEHHGDGEEEQ